MYTGKSWKTTLVFYLSKNQVVQNAISPLITFNSQVDTTHMERCLFDSKNLQSEISKTCTLAYRCSTDSDTTKGKKKKKKPPTTKTKQNTKQNYTQKKPHTPTKPPKQPPPKTNQPPPPKKNNNKKPKQAPAPNPRNSLCLFHAKEAFLEFRISLALLCNPLHTVTNWNEWLTSEFLLAFQYKITSWRHGTRQLRQAFNFHKGTPLPNYCHFLAIYHTKWIYLSKMGNQNYFFTYS